MAVLAHIGVPVEVLGHTEVLVEVQVHIEAQVPVQEHIEVPVEVQVHIEAQVPVQEHIEVPVEVLVHIEVLVYQVMKEVATPLAQTDTYLKAQGYILVMCEYYCKGDPFDIRRVFYLFLKKLLLKVFEFFSQVICCYRH